MKVIAGSVEEFFNNSEYKDLLMELDKTIQEAAPYLERDLYENFSITMIGYGAGLYKLTKKGKLPIISIAPQKNYVSVYFMAYNNKKSIVEEYADKLGKVNCGVGSVRIKDINDLNIIEFKKMIKDTILWNIRD